MSRETTILFASHIVGDLASVCDRLIVLAAGRVAYDASIAEAQSGHALTSPMRPPEPTSSGSSTIAMDARRPSSAWQRPASVHRMRSSSTTSCSGTWPARICRRSWSRGVMGWSDPPSESSASRSSRPSSSRRSSRSRESSSGTDSARWACPPSVGPPSHLGLLGVRTVWHSTLCLRADQRRRSRQDHGRDGSGSVAAGFHPGVPLVSREIEGGSAPLVWSLARSRRRWLTGRLLRSSRCSSWPRWCSGRSPTWCGRRASRGSPSPTSAMSASRFRHPRKGHRGLAVGWSSGYGGPDVAGLPCRARWGALIAYVSTTLMYAWFQTEAARTQSRPT